MRGVLAIALAVGLLGTGATLGLAVAQTAPSPAVEEFAESVGAVAFAAGQMVIQARVCGGDEKIGHDIRKLIGDRVRQCLATDSRLKEIAEQMDAAFDSMLTNAAVTAERRGKETVCALYRSPDLQVEVATALQMGTQLATDAGRERISRLPCPAKD
ncbi:hypothetical protein [Reyranella sp. CPCC 100927]|uniref:hypothetical protein n=1 Tax=Reyranella sp. CPCC 100927 TaxID=2599616 RepID=UPI0011B576BD|nr:hypothetical protein [Reyranella sp. CPCC 100927]TWS98457.1 hypothetical protein FQU96_35695 [Reyranella sp. CPCC 100927]